MSDMEVLQKAIKENSASISMLIQAEKNGERIKNEITSLQRKLEGIYAQIKTAQDDLERTKAESVRVQADTKKQTEDLLRNAAVKVSEADNRLARAKMLERNSQAKLEEAEELGQKYKNELAELNAKKERILAAIA